MKRAALVPATWLVDSIAGDPEWFPHPVRLIGLAVSRGEMLIRRPGQSDAGELITGASLTVAMAALSYSVTRNTIHLAKLLSPALGNMFELLLAWTCLAARNLHQEAASVTAALAADDLFLARLRLARVVGRDTHSLDRVEICRALIETLAESASDAIVAPLFYLTVGGVPLAMAYKAINTLDSMIGHADERYFFFGKAAARLDDAANYLPARLTAALLILAAALDPKADAHAAWTTWRSDGDKHKSPNAGQPESAMAGALHVQLGGDNRYDGELVPARHLGSTFPPANIRKAREAMRLVSSVTVIGVAAATVILLIPIRRGAKRGRK